jgi:hypothetical protein
LNVNFEFLNCSRTGWQTIHMFPIGSIRNQLSTVATCLRSAWALVCLISFTVGKLLVEPLIMWKQKNNKNLGRYIWLLCQQCKTVEIWKDDVDRTFQSQYLLWSMWWQICNFYNLCIICKLYTSTVWLNTFWTQMTW